MSTGRFLKRGAAFGVCSLVGYGAIQMLPRLSWRCSHTEHTPAVATIPSAAKIRLLSQNVWNSFFAGGPLRAERLDAFRQFLEDARVDIIATQEMFVLALGPVVDGIDAQTASEMLRSLGFIYQTSYLSTAPLLGQSSGLVLYSKFPISREAHRVFSSRRSVSCKGWLEAVVEFGEDGGEQRRLVILVTHLEHAQSSRWRLVREQQWKELASHAAQLAQEESSDTMIAVLGDFNVCGDEFGRNLNSGIEYAKLCADMREAGFPFDLISSPSIPTMRADVTSCPLRCSLDHVFVNSSLKNRVINANPVDTCGLDGCIASDHYGIVVDFSL